MAEKKTLMQNMTQAALDAQSAVERDRQAKEQAKFDKAFEDVKSGKIQPPRNDDMGPTQEEVEKERAKKEKIEALRGAREAMANKGKPPGMKKGGKVKCMAKGGSTASKRADGCATKGKTKGRII